MEKNIVKLLITVAIILTGVMVVYSILGLLYVSSTLATVGVVALIVGCILGWFIYELLGKVFK